LAAGSVDGNAFGKFLIGGNAENTAGVAKEENVWGVIPVNNRFHFHGEQGVP